MTGDEQDPTNPYAALVRELRLKQGTKQDALAAACGTSTSTISALETGRDMMGLGVAQSLDDALGAKGAVLAQRLKLLVRSHNGDEDLARRVSNTVRRSHSMADFDGGTDLVSSNDAGVFGLTTDFYRGVPWSRLLREAEEIDIFFTYGRSWRHTLTTELNELQARHGYAMRVILPDTSDPTAEGLIETAKRAGQTVEHLISHVHEARDFFSDVLDADIWLASATPLYASYRFDNTIVASLYNNQRGQTPGVPTILCAEGGSFYQFFHEDFLAMIDDPKLSVQWQSA